MSQPTGSAANDPAADQDVSKLSYEQAREQLVSVVSQLEAGGVTLERSLALWERGEALADHCESCLRAPRNVSRRPATKPGKPASQSPRPRTAGRVGWWGRRSGLGEA
nr:exodeoxyribonuclease VII small subunit [Arthrobacter sp. Bz4]